MDAAAAIALGCRRFAGRGVIVGRQGRAARLAVALRDDLGSRGERAHRRVRTDAIGDDGRGLAGTES
jgi:hypothetical protein